MASSINASTSSGIVQTADTSGILNLQSNGTTVASVSSTGVAVTGNITASGATGGIGYGPAFSAYQSTGQSVVNATFTKLQFQTEEFDTANAFDSTTNYRFTPQVAGYYQVSGGAGYSLTTQDVLVAIYKNGSEFKRGNYSRGANTIASALIYMNGSTDYVELYTYQVAGASANTQAGNSGTFFQACLVRSA